MAWVGQIVTELLASRQGIPRADESKSQTSKTVMFAQKRCVGTFRANTPFYGPGKLLAQAISLTDSRPNAISK